MIQLRNLTLARGSQPLVEDLSLQVHDGWRVGLVGANGSGKTSLLALLRGELQPELGDCELPTGWRIATVLQETPALPQAAIEYVLDGDEQLRGVEHALTAAQAAHDGERISLLHAELETVDGYAARARGAALMAGLGFSTDDLERAVAEFSGGWRMRLNLARALVSRADLMLLDEPTTHLDLDAIVWLERWLAGFPGTLIIISHDREFLDGCVTHVAHISARSLKLYTGNYSAFEEMRAERLSQAAASYAKQQERIAHLQKFIDRFKAKATTAKQAQSRVKALARMEKLAPVLTASDFQFEFREPASLPNPMLSFDGLVCGYGHTPIVSGVNRSVLAGQRIGILGANGQGKSTLVKTIAGALPPLGGLMTAGKGLVIGYFEQQ